MIKSLLRNTIVHHLWREYVQLREYAHWKKNGLPLPVPHIIKQGIVRDYARRHQMRIFFETGTYRGDMIWAVRDCFERIYSIELDKISYLRACHRFRKEKYITLLQGDSGVALSPALEHISEPCLFWLDAHFSGANTAKGKELSPVMEEIFPILTHKVKNHVILIDDAREFEGRNGYPDLLDLKKDIAQIRPDLSLRVELDIVRILKSEIF